MVTVEIENGKVTKVKSHHLQEHAELYAGIIAEKNGYEQESESVWSHPDMEGFSVSVHKVE